MIQEVSLQGIQFLHGLEGKKKKMYFDTRGFPTIGVGHRIFPGYEYITLCNRTINLMMDKLSDAELEELTQQDLERYSKPVADKVGHLVNQHQFDALVSICINIGRTAFTTKPSTFVKRIIAGEDVDEIVDAIMMWKNPPEIIGRRSCEARLFKTGNYYIDDKQYLNWTYEHSRY